MNPICPYCGRPSEKVTGKNIYSHRTDLDNKTFYRCKPCDAYVGCHPGTDEPLGRLANSELRLAKRRTHLWFDSIWKSGAMSRTQAYEWLAGQMGIKVEDCHIGMFDKEQCERVTRISRESIIGRKTSIS